MTTIASGWFWATLAYAPMPELATLAASILVALEAVHLILVTSRLRRGAVSASIAATTLAVAAPAVFAAANTAEFGPIVADVIHAVLQTDAAESSRYALANTSSGLAIGFSIWTAALAGTHALLARASLPESARPAWRIGAWVCGLAATLEITSNPLASTILAETRVFAASVTAIEASRTQFRERYAVGYERHTDEDLIVIIGESTTRCHMGIYGYPRDTTPLLSSLEASLLVFQHVAATHSHTVKSLADALVVQVPGSSGSPTIPVDVPAALRHQGWWVSWLSNQNSVGLYDTPVTLFATAANLLQFHDRGMGSDRRRSIYDEALLGSLRSALDARITAGARSGVHFVHLMTAHNPYCEIIPPSFATARAHEAGLEADGRWFGAELGRVRIKDVAESERRAIDVDCYDRAVRYVDFVVAQIIEQARDRATATAVLFFSDHGEAPALGTAHDSRSHTHFHIDVPLLFFANELFRTRHPDQWQVASSRLDQPLSLADLGPSLMHLAGSPTYAPQHSIFSPHFEPRERSTLHGAINLDVHDENADSVERIRAFLSGLPQAERDKIWAHRTNSVGAQMQVRSTFRGSELDVVFSPKDSCFHVYHPPAQDVGLDLEAVLGNSREHALWLDWKNFDASYAVQALAALESINSRHHIKHRAYLETDTSSPGIASFARAGWRTSYYLPTQAYLPFAVADSPMARAAATQLMRLLDEIGYRAFSFDARLKPFFDRHLRDFAREKPLDVLTWDGGLRASERAHQQRIRELASDDLIDVVLINAESPFSR